MVMQVIMCEQTNLNRGRSSTVLGSDCLIEMHWIHLRGCTIVPRFTGSNNSVQSNIFPNTSIIFQWSRFPKEYHCVFCKVFTWKTGLRVGLWLGSQHNYVWTNLWQTWKVMERAKWHFHRHNFQLTGRACCMLTLSRRPDSARWYNHYIEQARCK